jgi:hypothetical protein
MILCLLALGACARGSDVTPRVDRELQLAWRATTDERGAIVRGEIRNPYGLAARNIHLLVEGLDPAGDIVTRTAWPMAQIIRSGERARFDIPVPAGADRYRVTVVAFDFVLPRGGR